MRAAVLLLLSACAVPRAQRPVVHREAISLAAASRVIADGCTREPTTDLLVARVSWLLEHCSSRSSTCFFRVCNILRKDTEQCESPMVAGRR